MTLFLLEKIHWFDGDSYWHIVGTGYKNRNGMKVLQGIYDSIVANKRLATFLEENFISKYSYKIVECKDVCSLSDITIKEKINE